MGVFDKAKDFANDNPDKVNQGIEKGGDFIDSKTGDKYASQVDKGQDFVQDKFGGAGNQQAEQDQQKN